MLRAVQAGISIADMAILTVGDVMDICTEQANDREEYPYLPDQDDFDRF